MYPLLKLILPVLGLPCLGLAGVAPAGAQAPPQAECGLSIRDWCAAPPGDACGRHKSERECRADPACAGMRYRGESVVACLPDGKGFWTNCPAVGCISRSAAVPGQR
jgi:hypothetical protein